MSDVREERRLAAIVIGDVVGYSRMMGLDEVGTMSALKAHRRDLILPLLASYRARLVNTTGDAMLLEFSSAVDAVSCAAALQRGMQMRNVGVDPDRQICFRLGINLGDIVIDGNDIYGDGVNVAARLETMCEPGGLCLSRAIEEQVKDKLPFQFEDRGEQTLKNIARPLRVYVMTPAAIAELPEPAVATEARSANTTQLRVAAGTRLNDAFAIDRLIGSGGMGEIFQGHEIATGDTVAIKLIRHDMEGNETALALFQKEASVLKQVHHDAIVRYNVFSLDPTVRRHYLAMEFVDGPSLSDLMKSGPLPFEAVDTLRRRVASGLQVAHERGVVHRDLSPDNIILPAGDAARAKIIDFGIARSATMGGGTIIGGGFAGKFNYVSPEQLGLFGGDVTSRSDIYSFGLVLAGALLGQPIDMGGSQVDTIDKRRAVPPLDGIDGRLRPLLEAMLQPDPALRPASMAEVAAWSPGVAAAVPPPLPDFLPPPPARPTARTNLRAAPAPKPPRPRWIVGSALTLALLGAGGLGLFLWPSQQRPVAPPSPTLSSGTPQAEPNPAPSTSPGPAPAENPPASAPALPTVVPPSPPSAEAPTVPAPQPEVVLPVAPGAAQRVASFLRAYDGGPCFFAEPGQVTDHSAGVQGYAAAAESFEGFVKAFAKAAGFEPDLIGNRIWSRQCPAAAFLQATIAGAPPDLFIKSTRLRGGQTLSGEIGGVDNQSVLLLRVREDGSVDDLSGLLKDKGGAKDFDVGLAPTGGGGPFPQLIVAIASPKPLPGPVGGQSADKVFPALLKAAADQKLRIGTRARLVLLGG